ncbi:hypothetical protein CH313_06085 [Streptomyces sp. TSRI0384-2]|uniref:Uncharacterized protein n=1 Tax=Streptomyces griseus TaxID=1911 RepID=A0A380NES7_STRGR|nr:hypothetical protein [Streptomyces sp. DSM 41037]PJM85468.1 hypothetical protein CH313_06085 [Streptomyces sp. TSRI0384-2]RPK93285.1 hypothetical protein EES47_00720 [Streptomyces sp. ADI98-12]SUP37774.1 Uncharacterised protein [Streptomyces griseus]
MRGPPCGSAGTSRSFGAPAPARPGPDGGCGNGRALLGEHRNARFTWPAAPGRSALPPVARNSGGGVPLLDPDLAAYGRPYAFARGIPLAG